MTFFVGENGSGKPTLIEAIAMAAIAMAAGFNAEGGSRNFNFSTRASESPLYQSIRLVRGTRRPRTGFFLRAESFFNVATMVDQLGVQDSYGGRSLHEQSHGESFLALVNERFGPDGIYIMDEPEAALSPQRQLARTARSFDRLVRRDRSQILAATHSPIPDDLASSRIYSLDEKGINEVEYEQTEQLLADPRLPPQPRSIPASAEGRRGGAHLKGHAPNPSGRCGAGPHHDRRARIARVSQPVKRTAYSAASSAVNARSSRSGVGE